MGMVPATALPIGLRPSPPPADTIAGTALNADGRSHETLVELRKLAEVVAAIQADVAELKGKAA